MSVLINFKICDNCADCSGIKVCPVNAFLWSEEEKTIKIDEDKCINCGKCVASCNVNAIKLAKTKEEYDKITKEYELDPRTIADLYVERYGATKIQDIDWDISTYNDRLNTSRPVIIEINNEDNIECLIKSVPISEIIKNFHKDATYTKFFVDEKDYKKYNLKSTPVLRFYYKGKLLGEIEEYFTINEKYDYLEKIREFGAKIK